MGTAEEVRVRMVDTMRRLGEMRSIFLAFFLLAHFFFFLVDRLWVRDTEDVRTSMGRMMGRWGEINSC